MENRWLIYRQGAVGDTVLLSSVLLAIRIKDPNASIEVMGDLDRVCLLIGDQLADSIASPDQIGIESLFNDSEEPISSHLREYLEGFTHIVWYSGRAERRLGERLRIHSGQRIVVHPALPHRDDCGHAVNHYLNAIGDWFEISKAPLPIIQVTQAEKDWARQVLERWGWNLRDDIILGMHVGAGSKAKCAPLDRFLKITRRPRLGERVVVLLTQGPADTDAESVEAMRSLLGDDAPVRIARDFRLREIAALIQRCRRFIGNDSGVSHIASALGVTTDVFFVESDPRIWKPLGDHARVFDLRSERRGDDRKA